MPINNSKCNCCGTEYYVCLKCVEINSWKTTCCSRECYRNMSTTNKPFKQIKIQGDNMTTLLRAGLTNGKTIDIIGYDLELGKFDCSDNSTKVFNEIEYFIVPRDEMKSISEKLESSVEKKANIYSRKR